MPENLIEFRHSKGMLGQPYPEPFAASKGIPDRFKRLPPELTVNGKQEDTVKKCPPFVDAMSSGYLIPIIADVEFTMTAARAWSTNAMCRLLISTTLGN